MKRETVSEYLLRKKKDQELTNYPLYHDGTPELDKEFAEGFKEESTQLKTNKEKTS